jgi:hypothetical protein
MPVRYSSIIAKPVPGFPGYRATSEGNVETQWYMLAERPAAFKRRGPNPQVRGTEWIPVHTGNNAEGRPYLVIPVDASPTGRRQYHQIQKFVCLAFHGLPEPNQEVCHFPDPDVTNNRPENLRWGTKKDNFADRLIHGVTNRGERCGKAVLKEADVHRVRKLKATGLTSYRITKITGIAGGTVRAILSGKTWAWLETPMEQT